MASVGHLRTVTHRLSSTPVHELPRVANFLATAIGNCGEIIKSDQTTKSSKDEGSAVLVHTLKTRLSTLLQDRSYEARWSAVVLIKAVIEIGGWETLKGCEVWCRGMLAILGRPDPPTTKKLCILTITRIFSLTQGYPTLTREITTPLLPSFVTACLNLVSSKQPIGQRKLKAESSLLRIVLASLHELLPVYSSTFRPFASQMHQILLSVLSASSSSTRSNSEGTMPLSIHIPETVEQLAEAILISLHHCAPKNTSGDEWLSALRATLSSIHQAADQVFRAVLEDWQPSDTSQRRSSSKPDFSKPPCQIGPDVLGLAAWSGLYPGSRRISTLLDLLDQFMCTPTNSSVQLPVGLILDLTSRLTSVTVTSTKTSGHGGIRLNVEASRDEREELWAVLPEIHTRTLRVLCSLVETLQDGVFSVAQTIVEQLLWIFQMERSVTDIRALLYSLTEKILLLVGPSMSPQTIKYLIPVFKACCHDLLPIQEAPGTPVVSELKPGSKSHANGSGSGNADSFRLSGTEPKAPATPVITRLSTSAASILPVLLSHLPPKHIPHTLRTQIDRTSILTDNKEAMLSSVLHPPPRAKGRTTAPSILPFLARAYGDDSEVEGLVRPRLPVLQGAGPNAGSMPDTEDVDLAEEDEELERDIEAMQDHEGADVEMGSGADILDELENSLEDTTVDHGLKAQSNQSTVPANWDDHSAYAKIALERKEAKRSHEEGARAGHHNEPSDLSTDAPPPKKVRIESILNEAPHASAVQPTLPSETTIVEPAIPVPMPPVQHEGSSSAPITVQDPPSVSRTEGLAVDAEDSDDIEGIPTLNIEPDTEDEDEDDV